MSGWVDPTLGGCQSVCPSTSGRSSAQRCYRVHAVCRASVLMLAEQDVRYLDPLPIGAYVRWEQVSASSLGGLYAQTLLLSSPERRPWSLVSRAWFWGQVWAGSAPAGVFAGRLLLSELRLLRLNRAAGLLGRRTQSSCGFCWRVVSGVPVLRKALCEALGSRGQPWPQGHTAFYMCLWNCFPGYWGEHRMQLRMHARQELDCPPHL